MAIASVPRSRRALLAGGIGGMAAVAASALGRPLPVLAGADGDVVLGASNTATKTTLVQILTTSEAALRGKGTTGDGVVGESAGPTKSGVYGATTEIKGYGVFGRNWASLNTGYLAGEDEGVHGESTSGTGVQGESTSGTGVQGASSKGHGVYGISTDAVGVVGVSVAAFGVAGYAYGSPGAGTVGYSSHSATGAFGWSGTQQDVTTPALPAKTGVFGYAAQDAKSVGVRGACPPGTGVYGTSGPGIGVRGGSTSSFGVHGTSSTSDGVNGYSGSGNGVYGRSPGGTGVRGVATGGTGVYATATTGFALRAVGRVKLDKCAGVATITATTSSVVVTPGLDVTSTSFVLLTPKADLGTRRLWYTTSTTENTITIRVSSAVTANLKVGWLLLG